jgi:hypothetical protein
MSVIAREEYLATCDVRQTVPKHSSLQTISKDTADVGGSSYRDTGGQ